VIEQRNFADLEAGAARAPADATAFAESQPRPAVPAAADIDEAAKVTVAAATPAVKTSSRATIDTIVAEIEGTSDVARKKQLIYGLEESVRVEVVNEIKLRKERGEKARRALESELDDLFNA
jgi:hypothetical protein